MAILRDQVAVLLDNFETFARAQADADARAAARAFAMLLDTLQAATERSVRFDELRNVGNRGRAACAREKATPSSHVASCWEVVTRSYEEAVSQAAIALDRPFAQVLFGVQNVIAAGQGRDSSALRRANRTLRSSMANVLPSAARFAEDVGAAEHAREECERID